MAGRQYAQREWRLLGWWLAQYHPAARIVMNVRLGPTPAGVSGIPMAADELDLARVRTRWADAVVLEGSTLTLVEAKLSPDPGIFSQLLHYARLLRADPTWREYRDTPLHVVAVVYHDDPSVAEEAPFYGVKWVVYQPALDQFPPASHRLGAQLGLSHPVELPHDWAGRLQSWGIKLTPS